MKTCKHKPVPNVQRSAQAVTIKKHISWRFKPDQLTSQLRCSFGAQNVLPDGVKVNALQPATPPISQWMMMSTVVLAYLPGHWPRLVSGGTENRV
jgi:hypothetical protein